MCIGIKMESGKPMVKHQRKCKKTERVISKASLNDVNILVKNKLCLQKFSIHTGNGLM